MAENVDAILSGEGDGEGDAASADTLAHSPSPRPLPQGGGVKTEPPTHEGRGDPALAGSPGTSDASDAATDAAPAPALRAPVPAAPTPAQIEETRRQSGYLTELTKVRADLERIATMNGGRGPNAAHLDAEAKRCAALTLLRKVQEVLGRFEGAAVTKVQVEFRERQWVLQERVTLHQRERKLAGLLKQSPLSDAYPNESIAVDPAAVRAAEREMVAELAKLLA